MKKTAFLFAMFYLLNVVGYGLEVHYCLGQVSDINYAFLDTSCACDAAHSERISSSCCNEESFFVQLEDEHQSSSNIEVQSPMPMEVVKLEKLVSIDLEVISLNWEALKSPPLPIDRVVQFHSFIFYD
ncbi:MAG: hypothetical protein NWS74_07845 [Salibacteraceae bacterium]|jgi:hypothetical protein|nr:hypothetical protein [Salibacteraceae bacterium]MDP4934997.1 hypothetical protein [Salibacteraceae bacterium]